MLRLRERTRTTGLRAEAASTPGRPSPLRLVQAGLQALSYDVDVLGDAGDVVSGNRHDLDLGRHLSPSQGRISLPSRVIQPVPAPSPSAGDSSGVRPMSRWDLPAVPERLGLPGRR